MRDVKPAEVDRFVDDMDDDQSGIELPGQRQGIFAGVAGTVEGGRDVIVALGCWT